MCGRKSKKFLEDGSRASERVRALQGRGTLRIRPRVRLGGRNDEREPGIAGALSAVQCSHRSILAMRASTHTGVQFNPCGQITVLFRPILLWSAYPPHNAAPDGKTEHPSPAGRRKSYRPARWEEPVRPAWAPIPSVPSLQSVMVPANWVQVYRCIRSAGQGVQ